MFLKKNLIIIIYLYDLIINKRYNLTQAILRNYKFGVIQNITTFRFIIKSLIS